MKRQDSYLLFIYDFFQADRDQLTNDIPMKLLNLTDGTIKFVYGDYGMILYIETSYKFKKVKKPNIKNLFFVESISKIEINQIGTKRINMVQG